MNSALRCQVEFVMPSGENSGTYDGNLFLDLSFITLFSSDRQKC